jgi:hypothetical protein
MRREKPLIARIKLRAEQLLDPGNVNLSVFYEGMVPVNNHRGRAEQAKKTYSRPSEFGF